MNKKVAIILVNYNGITDTVECVKSIEESTYESYEIILVENGSNDYEKIKSNTYLNEKTTILFSDKNCGFSGGNNIAIRYALKKDFDYVLLLNNDTVVDKDFLCHLIETSMKFNAGIVTGDIYIYYEKNKLWYSAGEYNKKTGTTLMCGINKDKKVPVEVNFATGCLLLLSREIIENCGLLSDDFFLYSEDTDYCCNALRKSQKIVWTPNSKIYHKVSASSKENSPFQEYYLIRNNLMIIRKYGTNKLYAYSCITWHAIKEIMRGNYKLVPLLDAWSDFVRQKKGRSSKY